MGRHYGTRTLWHRLAADRGSRRLRPRTRDAGHGDRGGDRRRAAARSRCCSRGAAGDRRGAGHRRGRPDDAGHVHGRRHDRDRAYQSVDKALDIYYLSIAYLSTMRNWTSDAAFRIAQFLFYYRLVGVALFELTDERLMLLLFPNTFEYFFIAYELVRLRYDPSRISARFWLLLGGRHLDLRQAPAGVLDPHRQAGLHRHGPRLPVVRGGRRASRWSSRRSWSARRAPAPARSRLGVAAERRSPAVVARRRARALRPPARERSRPDQRGDREGVPAGAPVHHLRHDPAGHRRHDPPGRGRRRGDGARQRRDQPGGRAARRVRLESAAAAMRRCWRPTSCWSTSGTP